MIKVKDSDKLSSLREFSERHGIDLKPNGSTLNDLLNELCKAINKLEAKKYGN